MFGVRSGYAPALGGVQTPQRPRNMLSPRPAHATCQASYCRMNPMNAASSDAILVTGAAGFIGYHVARRLLEEGRAVVGRDNLNAYYDPALEQARLNERAHFPSFRIERCDLADRDRMAAL